MATYSATRAKHATLTASTVDTVTIGDQTSRDKFGALEIFNRDTGTGLYYTYSTSATAPADPTVAGDNTYYVPPSGAMMIPLDFAQTNIFAVKVISSAAAAYSVHGTPRSEGVPR